MRLLGSVVVAVILLAVLDRVALWAERRGWIFYRRRKPSSRSLGTALLEAQAVLEPRVREIVEAGDEQLPERDLGADPPGSGSKSGDRACG